MTTRWFNPMKTSAAAWKGAESSTTHKLDHGLDTREWKRKVARSQKTKVKTTKTNKGFE